MDIDTNKYIQFIVKGNHDAAPLSFWGFVQYNNSLQGQYYSFASATTIVSASAQEAIETCFLEI